MKIALKHQQLARILAAKSISQNRWAQRLGLDRGHLSQLVNGKRRYPSAATRGKLLRGLGVDFEELFEIELPEPADRPFGVRGILPGGDLTGFTEMEIERGETGMNSLAQDLKAGLRVYLRSPRFAAVVTVVLALAIGANGALFSLLDAVVLRALPYQESERLFLVYQTDRHRGTQREGFSVPDLLDLRQRSEIFQSTSGVRFGNLTLTESGDPVRLVTQFVSENHFQVLGVQPIIGRSFGPGDSQPGSNNLVLLSESLWIDRFGGASDVLGRNMTLDGTPYRIVGVMPPAASPDGAGAGADLIWVPLELNPTQFRRGMHVLQAYARLPRNVTPERAQQELEAVMAQLETDFAEDNAGRGAWLAGIHEELVRNVQEALWLLLGAVLCVLLIAGVNVANLFLTRLGSRRSEFALRSALGAGRGLLVRQILCEGFVFSLAGWLGGIGLAWLGTRWLVHLASDILPRSDEVGLDGRVVVFSLAVTILAWLLVSLIPAIRFSGVGLIESLREAGRPAGSAAGHGWMRNSFVVAQIGLAIILVIGAGLLTRSFWELTRIDPGVDLENVLSLNMVLPATGYPAPQEWPFLKWPAVNQFQDGALESVRAIPGVQSAAFSISNPLASGWTTRVQIEGRPEPPADQQEEAYFLPVSEDYFQTLGVPLTRGRVFESADDHTHPLVAVVNEAFAAFYFPDGASPIGEQVRVYGPSREIVGVVENIRFRGLTEESYPAVYLPARQNPISSLTLVVRTRNQPDSLLPQIREAVWSRDRNVAFFGVTTLADFIGNALGRSRFTLLLLSLFAGSAVLLAVLGIYGVVSFLVAERTQEIGIRMALGAGTRQVLGLVVGQGMLMVALGAVLGVIGALAASRLLSNLLYQIGAYDPLTFLLVPLLVVLVGAAACYLPARAASRLDPTEALRREG